MKTMVCFIAATLAFSASAQSSEVYKCVGPSGMVEYKNTGDTKGCKRVENAPVTVVPAPRAPVARSASSVSSTAQKQRDDDRRTILEGELKTQQDKLDALKAEYNNGEPERRGDEKNYQKYLDRLAQLKDDIARAEANVDSLKRELAAVPASAGR